MAKKRSKSAEGGEDLESRLEQIERKLDRLRGLYESFFMGIERAPPNVPRREMNRLVLEMQQEVIPKASLRYRFQAIQQRWVLFTAYWNRTLREIEAGTYRRDVARAQRHLAEKGAPLTEKEAVAIGIPAVRAKAFAERQQELQSLRDLRAGKPPGSEPALARAAAIAPAAGAPAGRAIPGVSEADVDDVYRRYIDTHRRINDPRPALTLEKIRERLSVQIPRVLAERNCKGVKLDVAVEDGKVRLKAWPSE